MNFEFLIKKFIVQFKVYIIFYIYNLLIQIKKKKVILIKYYKKKHQNIIK